MDTNQVATSNRLWSSLGKPNLNQALAIVLVAIGVGVGLLGAVTAVLT